MLTELVVDKCKGIHGYMRENVVSQDTKRQLIKLFDPELSLTA